MNTKLQKLLGHYSQEHQNVKNQKIHKFAVPLIMWSVLGLLFQTSFRIPLLDSSLPINLAWVLIVFSLIYYIQFKDWRVYLAVLPQVIPMMILIYLNPFPPIPLFLTIFVLAWIAQFIGHKIEGKKPSFFEDVQYLLIGPLWVLKGFVWKGQF